ncbi:N-acetylmuramic acid 6-phosphate etherase [Bacillus spizizenii]|uniref:N-acetylmuramic acid 6-phosphate etherase n=1 Tax=Bacillus spizizenii TaxID=96241 RepID=UPI0005C97CC1|nr:N-acetylmuramic acid 6-phosphate etherase [Bacillus spizizenii]MCY7761934.1 N-acetylmuramic acid 6-phosphate etherase [Bacillus spizizenii]MCY7794895.1 N-acetylmuramic acid 6-phosphate etherase [Bacillus spizizenii]MCY7825005.1 N-acetylmuramic acid 6-phosphate etherase [Bacillus spizizenii]MCY7831980.1 N-acetylmuramic acid 6-phosphate etherase [Bacillus spizizenii]MCY7874066.1 N-acetylmuramic acid 6-phosphate etherase [Bacillus spizizenii]
MSKPLNLHRLTTESRNSQTAEIHKVNTLGILKMINNEDLKVAAAVQQVLPDIKTAVDCAYDSFQNGGRLIYTGAGTSGRLGVMDAVECPPTYSVSPDQVIGIMAGGPKAFLQAAEGIEDSEKAGAEDLKNIQLTSNDTVIAIAASGRTPYAAGALTYARKVGAHTIALTCNENSAISKDADHSIEVVVGPEAITGSTRMKAATAHKMILNMISTAVMVKIGKVYENLMVDVNVSNKKLKERAISIIQSLTNASYDTARHTLEKANHHVKTAIVMLKTSTDQEQAKTLLDETNGFIDKAIEHYHSR